MVDWRLDIRWDSWWEKRYLVGVGGVADNNGFIIIYCWQSICFKNYWHWYIISGASLMGIPYAANHP